QIHGDVAEIAGEQRVVALGRDDDVLAAAETAEIERVEAGAAIDDITAVALIPDEKVVTGTHQRDVVAGTADDGVVAVASEDRVVAGTPVEDQADVVGREAACSHPTRSGGGRPLTICLRGHDGGDVDWVAARGRVRRDARL